MPHEIIWLVEKRVLLTTFHCTVNGDELAEFISTIRSETKMGIPLVHHISNSLDLQKVEFTLSAGKTLAEAAKMMGELGWQIDINQNAINRMFAGIVAQFARVRSRTYATMDEAVAFLKTNDPSLEELVWNFPEAIPLASKEDTV